MEIVEIIVIIKILEILLFFWIVDIYDIVKIIEIVEVVDIIEFVFEKIGPTGPIQSPCPWLCGFVVLRHWVQYFLRPLIGPQVT